MLTEVLDCKQSSNLRWARYDPATKILEIDFKDQASGAVKSTYAYDNYPEDGWRALQAAPNPGKFFAFHIRPHFTGRRLNPPPAGAPPLFAPVIPRSTEAAKPDSPEHSSDSLFAIS